MSDIVTSLQNEKVKLAYALQNRPRARRAERKIVLEGTRLIGDALSRGKKPEFVLYQLETADYDLVSQLQNLNVKLMPVNDEVMNHVSDTQQPQGMLGVFPIPMPALPQVPTAALILDAIREPGNMGTILRTAAAAGFEVVLLSPDCVDPYNPKVLRSGMGAHFRIPILELKWFEIADYTSKMAVYVADGTAETRYMDMDFTQSFALVIGNEAHGVHNTDKLGHVVPIAIPMATDTESINAGVAAGVLMFEAQRQRLTKPV